MKKPVETTIEAQMEDMPMSAYGRIRNNVIDNHRRFLKERGYNSDRMSDDRIMRISRRIADAFRPVVCTEEMLESYLSMISGQRPLDSLELSEIDPEILDRIVSIEDVREHRKSIGLHGPETKS